jgi:formylglycine-generating enzyme
MNRIFASLALFCGLVLSGRTPATAITIATLPVGNLGNATDPATSNLYGAVAYSYSIGKYDVTVGQYATFLNAVAGTDPYSLYNTSMGTDPNVAGISRSGSSGSFTYSVIGSANHPIAYINWGDAARFANWMSNGQPTGSEGNGTTEAGSYTLNGATTNAALDAVTRNANATWVIPTNNEWYKAAFYNPATSSYYLYPFSSSTLPTSAPPPGNANTGNFYGNNGNGSGYAVTGSFNYSSTQNYLTDVGAYTASASPYGAYDMGGDVYQWLDTVGGQERELRGGGFNSSAFPQIASTNGIFDGASNGDNNYGFRLAFLPPSILLGDMNFDGHVDAKDIAALQAALTNTTGYLSTNFGNGTPSSHGVTAANIGSYADVNGGAKFNNSDLQSLLLYLKTGHGSVSSVPEPSTVMLGGIGLTAIVLSTSRQRKIF